MFRSDKNSQTEQGKTNYFLAVLPKGNSTENVILTRKSKSVERDMETTHCLFCWKEQNPERKSADLE